MKRRVPFLDDDRLEQLETFVWKTLHGTSSAAIFDLIDEVKELRAECETLRAQIKAETLNECGAV